MNHQTDKSLKYVGTHTQCKQHEIQSPNMRDGDFSIGIMEILMGWLQSHDFHCFHHFPDAVNTQHPAFPSIVVL
jgi:hypothetical protein